MIVGGGFKAIRSVLRYSAKIGPLRLLKTLRSKNACKACAFGTGGQNGGIYNESRRGIEICNKNIQAHLSDIRPPIPTTLFLENDIATLASYSAQKLQSLGRLGTPLYKRDGDRHYSPIDYEKAIAILADKLASVPPKRTFFTLQEDHQMKLPTHYNYWHAYMEQTILTTVLTIATRHRESP